MLAVCYSVYMNKKKEKTKQKVLPYKLKYINLPMIKCKICGKKILATYNNVVKFYKK